MAANPVDRGDAVLVGRAEELALVAASLERGGCVIAGAAGVGKSRLAAEAAGRGSPIMRVVGTAAAASVPFGAFGHLLADVHVDARGVIAAHIDALRRRSPDRPATLLVDDAHLLDDASAALVLAICDTEAARVLATLRHGEPAPDAVTALWKERRLDRLDLGPLSRRELRALVESHLGAPADKSVHAKVFALTEGNPLYAHELLIDARRCGALAEADGRWCWTGRPPELTRLRDLIDGRTRDLNEDARSALEVLAVGAPLSVEELAAASSEDGVVDLERAGLAAVRGDAASLIVELAHPMFGEVIRAGLPAAAARRHRRRLAAALERERLTASLDLLRLATLKLESGEVDTGLFLRAGAYALQVQAGVPGPDWGEGHPALAIRLADAAGPGLAAALLGARARMALGRFVEVAERLAPLEDDAARGSFDQAAEYVRARVYALHWGGSGTDDALRLLDRARTWREEPDWIAVQSTLKAWILHDQARPASAAQAVGSVPQLDGLAPRIRLDALVVLALVESRLGLTDRCEALEAEIQRLADSLEQAPCQTGWARYTVDGFARAEAARDVTGVGQRLREARKRADVRGNAPLAAGLAMVLGRLELTRGHVREAIALLEEAADGLVTGDPGNARGWVLCHLTRGHALAGDCTRAQAALARAQAVAAARPSHLRLGLEMERVRAWTDAAHGRLSAARQRLLAVADGAGQALACEAEALYDAVRFGAAPRPCAERLRTLAARSQSELFDACAAHATALAAADPRAQMHAAERFAELGLDLLAAEAAAGAARALAAEGHHSSARRAIALSLKHAALCPGAVTPALALTPAGERLSPREREIAMLAAGGRTNAEIADELVLSVRTVETYVLRACHKLGLTARTDLRQVLTLDGGN